MKFSSFRKQDIKWKIPVLNGLDFWGARHKTNAVKAVRDDTGAAKLYVTVALDGRNLLCRIDTDYQMGLFLPHQKVKARNLWDLFPAAENRQLRNHEGRVMRTRFTPGPEFEIAGYKIANSPLTMADPTLLPDGVDRAVDGVIGMGILRRFNMLIDPDGSLWIKPNKHFV